MLISMDTQHRSFSRYKTKEPLLLIYGMPHAFELEAFNTDTDQPVDIQHLNLQYWKLSVVKSLSTPAEVLLATEWYRNIALQNKIQLEFSTATEDMYKYVAGNPDCPAVMQITAYPTVTEATDAQVIVQLPVTLRTTVLYPQPPTLPDALVRDMQKAAAKAEAKSAEAEAAVARAHTWAEGTDEQVEELGGTHSAKGWAQQYPQPQP